MSLFLPKIALVVEIPSIIRNNDFIKIVIDMIQGDMITHEINMRLLTFAGTSYFNLPLPIV